MRRDSTFAATIAAVLAIAAGGCTTRELCAVVPATDPGPSDPGGTADVPVADEAADSDGTVGDVADRETVVPASYVPASSFRFRGAGRDGDGYRVEVVARDVPAAFGIALRVEWDPAALALVSAVPAPVMGDDGAGESVHKAAEVRPGSLAIGLAHLYPDANTALDGDVVVATLVLKPMSDTPTGLRFFEARCLVLGSDRAAIEAAYLPSTLVP